MARAEMGQGSHGAPEASEKRGGHGCVCVCVRVCVCGRGDGGGRAGHGRTGQGRAGQGCAGLCRSPRGPGAGGAAARIGSTCRGGAAASRPPSAPRVPPRQSPPRLSARAGACRVCLFVLPRCRCLGGLRRRRRRRGEKEEGGEGEGTGAWETAAPRPLLLPLSCAPLPQAASGSRPGASHFPGRPGVPAAAALARSPPAGAGECGAPPGTAGHRRPGAPGLRPRGSRGRWRAGQAGGRSLPKLRRPAGPSSRPLSLPYLPSAEHPRPAERSRSAGSRQYFLSVLFVCLLGFVFVIFPSSFSFGFLVSVGMAGAAAPGEGTSVGKGRGSRS